MGEAQPYTIEMYVTHTGSVPFEEWILRLRDIRARARIRVRLARVRLGNLGDAHTVGGGVWELRIDYGPGYRVYYAQSCSTTLLLLCGGDKTTLRQLSIFAHEAGARALAPANWRGNGGT
jgi:putative addiction module killer protein